MNADDWRMQSMERSNRWVGPTGVILLALGVRSLLCAQPACIGRDGVHFVSFAKQLADDPITWMRITTKQPESYHTHQL